MLVSKCHHAQVSVIETENGAYYVCAICDRSCDTYCVMCFQDWLEAKDIENETMELDKIFTMPSLDPGSNSDYFVSTAESLRPR